MIIKLTVEGMVFSMDNMEVVVEFVAMLGELFQEHTRLLVEYMPLA